MINVKMIVSAGNQLSKTLETISAAACAIDNGCTSEVYETILLDCITHAQMLTLEMTKLISDGAEMNGDSVFGPGELDTGSKEIENPPDDEEGREKYEYR